MHGFIPRLHPVGVAFCVDHSDLGDILVGIWNRLTTTSSHDPLMFRFEEVCVTIRDNPMMGCQRFAVERENHTPASISLDSCKTNGGVPIFGGTEAVVADHFRILIELI